MSILRSVPEINRELAQQINHEARQVPGSCYANKFVGLANGQVVVIADNLDDLSQQLRNTDPDPANTFWLEANRDYDEVVEI